MKFIPTLIALCVTQMPVFAGTNTTESGPIGIPPASSEWEFQLKPYGWFTAIDGTTGPQGFPGTIDAGFDDVLDVLEMAAALQFEARKGRWGCIGDIFYAELGTSGVLPGPLATNIDLGMEQFIGEAVVFYRASETPHSFVDLYAGFRHNSLSLDLVVTAGGTVLPVVGTTRSGEKSWTDPIIGARSQWDMNDRWYLAAKGDIGGFGVESDLTLNLHGSVGYKFNETVSLEVGYRYFSTDYSDSNFIYDVDQSGALIGLNFTF